MAKQKKRPYRLWLVFDTETTNIRDANDNTRAFPILYIFNDISGLDVDTYEVDDTREHIDFFRYEGEAIAYIFEQIERARAAGVIPVMCTYNMIFDLQTIMEGLHDRYTMEVNAQSSTNVYTLDLYDGKTKVLRIWDTYHLEIRGLKAMGRTCGVAKLMGDWDYSLVRTPETRLTDAELGYAARDVQVIPAYLRYLCEANGWLTPGDFGNRVLTKTSLVRQMARREIGPLRVRLRNGKTMRLIDSFVALCRRELPKDFESHAIRLACFRGGLTFTAAGCAGRVVHRVASLDETSAHHAFINGRRVPVGFAPLNDAEMKVFLYDIGRYKVRDVLHRYAYPFQRWFHIAVRIKGLRLKRGSAFDAWGIALLAQAKFERVIGRSETADDNERAIDAYEDVRSRGYVDSAVSPVFAFSKLVSADECIVHVSELEWWCMLQVYDWDEYEPLYGEGTINSRWAPDYVCLQSNMLFERKTDAKTINNYYTEGTPYPLDIPASIPDNIADGLRTGALSNNFVSSWYGNTVKGQFNGIYGVQAQNVLKAEYEVEEDAELVVNPATRCTPETFEDKIAKQKKPTVLYPYGLRIVGGSRMQLVIAIMLLWERFGDSIMVTGGDTDSLKVACVEGIEATDLIDALKPLHRATTAAINLAQARLRAAFPDLASSLDDVGCFEVEPATPSCDFYTTHMEAWPKARVSVDDRGHAHVTCAGLSRPHGAYTIERWLDGMHARGHAWETLLPRSLGYNVSITNEVSHALDHHKPRFTDRTRAVVSDYQGRTCAVDTHEAIAIFETSRRLGDTTKRTNAANVRYLTQAGVDVDTTEKILTVEPNFYFLNALAKGSWCANVRRYLVKNLYFPQLYKQTVWGMEVMK